MTMCTTIVSKTLKHLQKTHKLTCKQIAEMAGVSESAVVRYGLGERNIPEDVVVNLARNGGLEELKSAYRVERKLGIINVPIMNNIDDNLQCMTLRIVREEIPEAVEAFWSISDLIMNKKSLSNSETEELYKHMEQIADLIPAIETYLVKLKRNFNISLERLDMTECQKFREKCYVIDIDKLEMSRSEYR